LFSFPKILQIVSSRLYLRRLVLTRSVPSAFSSPLFNAPSPLFYVVEFPFGPVNCPSIVPSLFPPLTSLPLAPSIFGFPSFVFPRIHSSPPSRFSRLSAPLPSHRSLVFRLPESGPKRALRNNWPTLWSLSLAAPFFPVDPYASPLPMG